MAKLPKIISLAKITPASGAWKVALIPAAAPAATKTLMCRAESLNICPDMLPSEAPICTIGPSRPIEPPVPMHRPLARIFTSETRGRITPSRRATA